MDEFDADAAHEDLARQMVDLQPRLVRFAYSLTHNREAAEDLAQETLLRALASQWRFRPGTNLKAWLFRIMRNLHLNTLRDAANRPGLVSIDEMQIEPFGGHSERNPTEAHVIRRADLARIAEAYRSLPPALGVPLHLTAVEELSYAEVAGILGIPLGTVMSRIYRARRLLFSLLDRVGR